MRYLMILLFLFSPIIVSGQLAYKGIDVTALEPQGDEWKHYEDKGIYTRDGVGYFDSVDMHKFENEQVYSFNREDGTGMVFTKVYNELRNKFGEESSVNDYIPSHAGDDWDYISILIDQEKAEVDRVWYPKTKERMMVNLIWNKKMGFSVLFFRNLK